MAQRFLLMQARRALHASRAAAVASVPHPNVSGAGSPDLSRCAVRYAGLQFRFLLLSSHARQSAGLAGLAAVGIDPPLPKAAVAPEDAGLGLRLFEQAAVRATTRRIASFASVNRVMALLPYIRKAHPPESGGCAYV
jgi:hypothetical protein